MELNPIIIGIAGGTGSGKSTMIKKERILYVKL